MKKELFVFTTTRKLKEYLNEQSNAVLPKTMIISEFFSRAIYSPKFDEVSKIDKLIIMQKAISKTKNLEQQLKISSNFFEFLKNHEYIFSFFKELAVTKKKIEDLKYSDIYASYDEHLEILEELLKNYKLELKDRKLYDDITIVDDYLINEEFIKSYDEINIFIDGVLTNFEIEILNLCKNFADINLVLNANYLTKKMLSSFVDIENSLEIANEYIFNLTNNSLSKVNNAEKNHNVPILVRGLSGNSMQCFYIFEKISTFIKDGINPKDIVVILPDESFSEILMDYDKNNMLNFAMGKKAENLLFYKLFNTIIKSILEEEEIELKDDYIKNEDQLTSVNIFLNECGVKSDFYRNFENNFYQKANFDQFKKIVFEILEYSKEHEISGAINEILFNIEIYLENESLNLREISEIFLLELKNSHIDYVGGGEVSVMGLLESRGLSFRGVIMPCFNDELVPKRSINEMFLNTTLRKRAGLISYEDRQNLQRFYYKDIINKAKKVAICYDDNEDKVPSRFLKEFKIIEDKEYSDKSYLNLFRSKRILKKGDLNLVFKHDFFEQPLSFSRLDQFLKCPRCYALKYILKIQPPKDVDSDMSAKDRGNILHKALELTYNNSNIFDYKIFEEMFMKISTNLSELEKQIMLNEFKKIEQELKKHEDKGYRLIKKEIELENIFEGVRIKGKIDRIDALNGEKFIIDYKSGSIRDKKSLQLPFYEALLGEENVKSAFFSLRDVKFVNSQSSLDDLKNVIDELKQISGKDFDFDVSYNCKYKDYDILCD
ncbi:sugar transferase [Campylobacter blaseri]|uniref:Sugar transferase n=1 Tax=Campylobacter blaseri TaxID=2042961 RepID=A0A2P8QZI0_9BACT|nr:sugar transferase [Campylobacter blaseri]PSM53450.1 sugar transferase [Campylobacter blaseri]